MNVRALPRATAALIALVAGVAGVPWLLLRLSDGLGVNPIPTQLPTIDDVKAFFLTPDLSMHTPVGILLIVGWLLWAMLVMVLGREAAAAIGSKGRRTARPIRGTDWLARPVAQLVTAILLVFAVAPAAGIGTATPASAATSTVTATTTQSASHAAPPSLVGATATAQPRSASPVAAPARAETAAPTYTVQRRDTLWGIAGRALGDPTRWRELVALNHESIGAAPDYLITPGTVLRLPPSPTSGTSTTVTVDTGDTISGIAAEHGISDWTEIWPANAGRNEPGGARLTNPDHIEPGWSIDVGRAPGGAAPALVKAPPAAAAPAPAPSAATPGAVAPDRDSSHAPKDHPAGPSTTVTPAPSQDRRETSAQPVASAERATTSSLAGVFAGGGVLLASGMLGALVMARRRQFRNRPVGRTIGSTPPELVPIERAVLTYGRAGTDPEAVLDLALRALSVALQARDGDEAVFPDVTAARLDETELLLRLARRHPSPPPAPWVADDEDALTWRMPLDAPLPCSVEAAREQLAPLPALAAVGYEDNGASWMLDLERGGSMALTGDVDRCRDLGRFLAGLLARSAWADHLRVTLVGFGAELVALNPERVTYTQDVHEAAERLEGQARRIADRADLAGGNARDGRLHDLDGDMWMPHVVLVAPEHAADPNLARLLTTAGQERGRTAMAVVLAGGVDIAAPVGVELQITAAGDLRIPGLDIDLTANRLPVEEAAAIAAMLAAADTASDEAMPAATAEGWGSFADAAGGLRPEYTLPRAQAPVLVREGEDDEDLTSSSVLPLPDTTYLEVGATTADDLQAMAPRVAARVHDTVENVDPTLDADLQAWADESTPRPKVRVLGPVSVTAHGTLAKREEFYTELVTFLALRPNGATKAELEEAFNFRGGRHRTDVNVARAWLGADPLTGVEYLPHATQSSTGKTAGQGVYAVEEALVDLDLFRRLRVRAQARGEGGLADLVQALTLVSGRPFDRLRLHGYGWLLEGERHDYYATCAVLDVAHAVATAALGADDVAAARAAVEVAMIADPFDEKAHLDMAAVREAEGNLADARAIIEDEVCNRSEDDGAPEDLPSRTRQILARRDWVHKAS